MRKIVWFIGLAILSCSGAACADEKADTLLKEVRAAYQAARTLTFEFEETTYVGSKATGRNSGTAKMMKPNVYRVEMPSLIVDSDGKTLWRLWGGEKYTKEPVRKNFKGMIRGIYALGAFFGLFPGEQDGESHIAGEETVEGLRCTVVEFRREKPTPRIERLFVGPARLIHRGETVLVGQAATREGSADFRLGFTLKNVRVGAPLTATDFRFEPPKTARLYDPAKEAREEERRMQARLVKVGADAPNFTLASPTGGQVALGEALRGKKALLVNFWFYH